MICYLPLGTCPMAGKFEMWNHTFLWVQCNSKMLEYVVKGDQVLCMNNLDKILLMKGGGHCDKSSDFMLDQNQKIWILDDRIILNDQKLRNNCIWLSTLLLVQLNDPNIANRMINMLNEDNASFQWMFLTKLPSSNKVEGNERGVITQSVLLKYQ